MPKHWLWTALQRWQTPSPKSSRARRNGAYVPAAAEVLPQRALLAVSITALGGPVSFTEGGAPVFLTTTGVVTDTNSADFNGGSLAASINGFKPGDAVAINNQGNGAGQIGVAGSTVRFSGAIIGTFSGGTSTPLVVNFTTAAATPAAAQALLRNLTFVNTNDNAFSRARTIDLQIDDGDGEASPLVSKVVNVTAINDAPVIGSFGGNLAYNENGNPIRIAPSATLTDPDSANFNAGRLTFSFTAGALSTDRLEIRNQGTGAGQISLGAGNVVRYQGVDFGVFSGGVGTPLTVDFNSAAATKPAIQALIRNVTYRNVFDNPTAATRTVQAVVTDGDGGTSAPVAKNIAVFPVNDGPTVQNFGGASIYTEGAPRQLIASTVTVTDPDSANFNGGRLTIQIAENAVQTDRLFIRNTGTGAGQVGVNGSIVTFGGVQVGTLSGGLGSTPLLVNFTSNAATRAATQAIVRNLEFFNTGDNPTTGTRLVNFSVNDGDGAQGPVAGKRVFVNVRNDAPVISNVPTSTTYALGSAPIAIAGQGVVSDADSINFAGGQLRFLITNNADGNDVFAIPDQGTDPGQIGLDGNIVLFGGEEIGTFTGGVGGALTITFNSVTVNASVVQTLLRNVTYQSVGTSTALPRPMQITLSDGDGGTSTPVGVVISLV